MTTPNGYPPGCCGITRRGLLVGMGAGLALGAPLGWLALKGWQSQAQPPSPFTGRSIEVDRPALAMPGPYPGRVIEVRHRGAVNVQYQIQEAAVQAMMARGMCELTGAPHPSDAWKRFFEPSDVVGIKVNPVGRARRTGEVGSISSPAVLIEVVQRLKGIGIPPRNIIVFERYADEFRDAGYEQLMSTRPMDGVRWYASATNYTNEQLSIDGQDDPRGRHPNVVGYDPNVFVSMGFCWPGTSPRDERRFRSHLSVIISRMVNKFITIPCLKDHRSGGVTLALKNLSHGLNNNVARSHIGTMYHLAGGTSHPNQCNTFIPTAVAQEPIRQKATLHIMDGLIGVYEGGPGSWNPTWGVWRRQSLFFATDPVALDHVGWDIIDTQRAVAGWLPVASMGSLQPAPAATLSPRLAALSAIGTPGAALAAAHQAQNQGSRMVEQFDRRQPEHVILAGLLGLGVWDARQIEHRVVWEG